MGIGIGHGIGIHNYAPTASVPSGARVDTSGNIRVDSAGNIRVIKP